MAPPSPGTAAAGPAARAGPAAHRRRRPRSRRPSAASRTRAFEQPRTPVRRWIACRRKHLAAFRLTLGVIGAADERTSLHMGEAEITPDGGEVVELLRPVVLGDGQMRRRRAQILTER